MFPVKATMKSVAAFVALTLSLSEYALASPENALLVARMPEPTPAPNPVNVARHILKHRAVTADNSRTCGFVKGDYSNSVTCTSGYHCTNKVYTNGILTYSVAGCCPDSGAACTLHTSCYDSSEYRSLSRTLNDFEVACTASSLYYCKKFVEGSYQALGCGTASTVETVLNIASVTSPYTSYSSMSRSSSYSSSTSPRPSSSSSQTSPSPNPANTSPAPSPNPSPVSASVSLSTGAIIGIAVAAGAVGLSAIVATFVICCLRQRRRRAAINPSPMAAIANVPPPPPGGAGGPMGPGVTDTGFNYVTQPPKDERLSGQTYAATPTTEYFLPNKFENMPPLRPEDAPGEAEVLSNVGSNAGRTVTSVPSEGYNPPRV